MNTARTARMRRAFTLVELLTVILIISILTGLITAAAISAKKAVRRATMRTEISQLEMALQEYKNQFGEYPPDFSGLQDSNAAVRNAAQDAVISHLRRAFPRYQLPAGDPAAPDDAAWTQFRTDVANYGLNLDVNNFDPVTALVFWLGGLPDGVSGNVKPAGFSANPTQPFQTGLPRTQPLYEFKLERLVAFESGPGGVTRYFRYYPTGFSVPGTSNHGSTVMPATADAAPYVYFKARRVAAAGGRYEYGFANNTNPARATIVPAYYRHGAGTTPATMSVAVPYLDEFPGPSPYFDNGNGAPPNTATATALADPHYCRRWRNLETFQIVCPGLDGQYGDAGDPTAGLDQYRFRFTRSGQNFCVGGHDYDNLANFAEGALEDEMQ
jgi:prepilin-type N-terminal cleavage/methylation domain-containing protein